MELMISGAFADKVLSLIKKDKGLAVSLAAEWLERVDSSAIANYLLTPEIAVELLAGRLVSAPEQTVDELQALAQRHVDGDVRRRTSREERRDAQFVAFEDREESAEEDRLRDQGECAQRRNDGETGDVLS